jgi:hypothetical protein
MKGQLCLAIVGWRGMTNQELFDATMEQFVADYGLPDVVVSGGATGADTMGEKWAKDHNIPTQIYKPVWRNKGVYDKSAGIKRNTDIVNACTHMVAFPSDKGKGTQDSIQKAKKEGKIVIEIKL